MKENIRNYIGKPEQLFSVREGRFSGGKADGVRFIEVDNGTGLNVTLLPDRCLDIYQVRINGRSLNYLTANGITAPAYYSPFGEGWSDGFFGGFLFTCGLTNIGSSCVDQGEKLGCHGRISSIPADRFAIVMGEKDGVPQVTLPTRPETNSGRSASFRAVAVGLFPGARRARKACSRSISMAKPAGMPSMVTPMAAEWDWPKIVKRNRSP